MRYMMVKKWEDMMDEMSESMSAEMSMESNLGQ